jgi:hypothetical protein
MDVWSPDHQVDPLERIKRLDGEKGIQFNHRRHPGRSWEISVFLFTFLIVDVPLIIEVADIMKNPLTNDLPSAISRAV